MRPCRDRLTVSQGGASLALGYWVRPLRGARQVAPSTTMVASAPRPCLLHCPRVARPCRSATPKGLYPSAQGKRSATLGVAAAITRNPEGVRQLVARRVHLDAPANAALEGSNRQDERRRAQGKWIKMHPTAS